MIRLAGYLRHFKKEVIIGPFFKLLEAIFELIVPLVTASMIDIGIKNNDKAYVLQRGGIILLLGFVGLIFALICQYNAARASQGYGTRLRNDLFSHINTLTHGELDQLGTNYLITVLTNDVNQMQLAVAMLIRLVVRAPFLVIGAAIMAMILDLKLSVIFLIVMPLVSAVLYIVMKKSVPFYRRRQKALDRISLLTRENLTGVRVIRAFSKQVKEEARFEQANEEAAQIAIRVGKLSAFLSPATFIIMNLAIIAILWFGGIRVNIGNLTQGEVIAFINYMTQISLALVVVANLVVIFTKAGASATRINRVLDTKPAFTEGSCETAEEARNTEVPILELKDVSFAYPEAEEYSLENINVTIMEGETVGIIGGTGSGKSSLINLLPRFYEVSRGEIKLDGLLLKDYTFDALRKQFGLVPQKAVLFKGSILDNLKWAKETATEEEIKKAIKIAQAEDFVERLSNRYDTVIQQGGKNLSGGQRQRLTIARALVGNPRILILDDSFSALDYATDAALRRSLKESCGKTTIIMVSQRANTIKHADKIIVLEDGRIAGVGKHQELFASCEVYREICLSQLSSEEVNR
jgi:ATP-binding cassette subfamily B protein